MRRITKTILITVLLVLLSITHTLGDYRNANPNRDFAVVETPTMFFDILTPGFNQTDRMAFFPTFGGGSLPASGRIDQTIDVPIMLPHKDDDIDGCGTPWQTQNEFGQSFAGAFILVRQSACTYTTYAYAAASGAAGILAYGCPGTSPFNCNTKLQEVIIYVPSDIPILAISTADGDALVAFLQKAKAAGTPPLNALEVQFISTGTIDPAEKQALVDIMATSTMASFAGGSIPDVLPRWSSELFTTPGYDPCIGGAGKQRAQGIWCERGNIVSISIFYRAFYSPTMPPQFGAFHKLRYLNLQANALAGPVPPEWCALTELQSLFLDVQAREPSITRLPDCINRLGKLTELRMFGLSVDYLPASMSNMTSIQIFALAQNFLPTIPDVSTWVNLVEFDVGKNLLTTFPTFHPAAPLAVVSIGANLLEGTIPPSMFENRPSLEIVDCNTNRLVGPLPSFAGSPNIRLIDLGSQRDLVASTGGFTGPMPASWAALKKLTSLQLQENQITMPVYCNTMQSLQYVDVSHNLLDSFPTTEPDNAAGVLLNALTSPSQVTIRAAYNKISGPLASSNFLLSKTVKELFLSHNQITALTRELFISPLVTVDMSFNNISMDGVVTDWLISYPNADMILLDLRSNPYYAISELSGWMYLDDTKVQSSGSSFSCSPIKCLTAPLMSFLVDPSFTKYKYCDCQSGTFGKAPYCSHVPNAAILNPNHIIRSSEIGDTFPTLIQSANGTVGSDLTLITGFKNSTGQDWQYGNFSQLFSDAMYGQSDRLTLGMATSWEIDVSNIYQDDPEAYKRAKQSAPTVLETYTINGDANDISDKLRGVRMILLRLYISGTYFQEFDDVLNVYEGSSDLKGTRVETFRGSDGRSRQSRTYSDKSLNDMNYLGLYNTSISKVINATLIEVRVFSSQATIQFQSRDSQGLHFLATYEYEFECPEGFFFNEDVSPAQCRVNREIFYVGSEIRAAVFAVSAAALAFVIFNIAILFWKWESPVYKAASRPFMLLILLFFVAMGLGALLYAAIPDIEKDSSDAVCIGRAWLTCLPLAGVLAVLLAKTNRLNSIFGSSTLQVKAQTDLDILLVVAVVCAAQIIMLGVFSGMPLSEAIQTTGKGSLSDELVTQCSQESGFMAWIGVEIAFIVCLMLPAAYLGFKTRDLPSQYNESSHIQNALILLLFFGIIIVPLDIFIQDNPEAAVLIQGLGQAFLCIILTSIIFGPKLYFLTQAGGRVPGHTYAPNDSVLQSNASSYPAGAQLSPKTQHLHHHGHRDSVPKPLPLPSFKKLSTTPLSVPKLPLVSSTSQSAASEYGAAANPPNPPVTMTFVKSPSVISPNGVKVNLHHQRSQSQHSVPIRGMVEPGASPEVCPTTTVPVCSPRRTIKFHARFDSQLDVLNLLNGHPATIIHSPSDVSSFNQVRSARAILAKLRAGCAPSTEELDLLASLLPSSDQ